MKFLILLLAIVPIYASRDIAGDLLGQELQYSPIDHVREKRQSGNYRTLNQAPPHVQQLVQAQNSRRPLIPIPPQPIPKLGLSHPIEPQQVSQAQVSQYKPQVQFSSNIQQPDYRAIQGGQYKKPLIPQAANYRPLPQQNYNPQQPQYSQNLPPQLQQLLQYQSSLANGIPQRA